MNRLDRFLTARVISTVMVVIVIVFGIIALGEATDTGRFRMLSGARGDAIAWLAIVMSAARWTIKALPVIVLLGGIVALLNLQVHSELVVLKVTGLSVWQIMRGPVVGLFFLGILVSALLDAPVTQINRFILPANQVPGFSIKTTTDIWLKQVDDGRTYVVTAARADPDKRGLGNVVVFLGSKFDADRVIAKSARLEDGNWLFSQVRLLRSNQPGEARETYRLKTESTAAELDLRLSAAEDFTLFEIGRLLAVGISDPTLRSAAATRFARLLALPAFLVGTLLIAFAFTAGYRRTQSYGGMVLYGIVLGFVMFVINEMSDRAGSAGILSPELAALGPATVAIVIGVSVLLYKEDGRT